MTLRGHSILIVESDDASFVRSLQTAIKRTGAESVVARDREAALVRAKRFKFSAAVINADHLELVDQLGIPVLLCGTQPPPLVVPFVFIPTRPAVIVFALERLVRAQS